MKIRNKIFITFLAFSLASLALIFLFISPLFDEIARNSSDIVSAKNSIAALDAQAVKTDEFKKNYSSYEASLQKIDKLFVDSSDPVDFIKFLEDTAALYNITSQISLSLPADSKKPQQSFITVQFFSQGSFSDILKFSKNVELGPYLVEIENLSIQNLQESEGKKEAKPLEDYSLRKVKANFSIKVFTTSN